MNDIPVLTEDTRTERLLVVCSAFGPQAVVWLRGRDAAATLCGYVQYVGQRLYEQRIGASIVRALFDLARGTPTQGPGGALQLGEYHARVEMAHSYRLPPSDSKHAYRCLVHLAEAEGPVRFVPVLIVRTDPGQHLYLLDPDCDMVPLWDPED